MLSGISGYLLPEHNYYVDKVRRSEAALKNYTVSIVTNVINYLFPSAWQSDFQSSADAMPSPCECDWILVTGRVSDAALSERENFHRIDISESDVSSNYEQSIIAVKPTPLSVSHGEYPHLDECEKFSCVCLDDSGPMALPYLGSSSYTIINDCYPDQNLMIRGNSVSVAPESLFETSSMVYIPREGELVISTVIIAEGSELARQLGVSGETKVDKVFYEAGSGAIIAQVMIRDKPLLFTLFSIDLESNILPDETEYTGLTFAQQVGTTEKFFAIKKGGSPKFLMQSVKQFCCNNSVHAVINEEGNDITEAIKVRMFQEERRLASNPEPLKVVKSKKQIPVSARLLEEIQQRKKEWLATQRNTSRLKIRFEDNYTGGRYPPILPRPASPNRLSAE